MNRLVRFLLMFGPMIFRQYQKYQNKKQREEMSRSRLPQQRRQESRNPQREYGEEQNDGRYYKSRNTPPPSRTRAPEPKKTPPISEDEKNFRMKEEEFMLDPETESEYQREIKDITDIESDTKPNPTDPYKNIMDDSPNDDANLGGHNPIERADNKSGFNIKDLFIKPDDEADKDA